MISLLRYHHRSTSRLIIWKEVPLLETICSLTSHELRYSWLEPEEHTCDKDQMPSQRSTAVFLILQFLFQQSFRASDQDVFPICLRTAACRDRTLNRVDQLLCNPMCGFVKLLTHFLIRSPYFIFQVTSFKDGRFLPLRVCQPFKKGERYRSV
jgi:hypothetical protein